MKYEELRQYLKKNPYCFRTMKEREEEINNKIMEHEGRRKLLHSLPTDIITKISKA